MDATLPPVPAEPPARQAAPVPEQEARCPACDYDLRGQPELASKLTCPECGEIWHRDQLRAFLAGKPYWGPVPKILCGLPVVAALWALIAPMTGLSTGQPELDGLIVAPIYLWPCMTWLAFMNSRRRHGDFSYVVGVVLGMLLTLGAVIALPFVAIMVLVILSGV
jgi:predicted RNA-binding Zn-ribbon protein involved in translation (DUF1610 family)